jgi:hypothetical protein
LNRRSRPYQERRFFVLIENRLKDVLYFVKPQF